MLQSIPGEFAHCNVQFLEVTDSTAPSAHVASQQTRTLLLHNRAGWLHSTNAGGIQLMQAEVRGSVPLVTAKHSFRAHGDVWLVPHAVNASRPALHAAFAGDSSVRSTVAELLAAPADTTCAAPRLST